MHLQNFKKTETEGKITETIGVQSEADPSQNTHTHLHTHPGKTKR